MLNKVCTAASFIPRTCVRRLSTTLTNRGQAPDLTALKQKQKQFQTNIDVPIYLRGGASDHVLLYITIGLTAATLAFAGQNIYTLANKK